MTLLELDKTIRDECVSFEHESKLLKYLQLYCDPEYYEEHTVLLLTGMLSTILTYNKLMKDLPPTTVIPDSDIDRFYDMADLTMDYEERLAKKGICLSSPDKMN